MTWRVAASCCLSFVVSGVAWTARADERALYAAVAGAVKAAAEQAGPLQALKGAYRSLRLLDGKGALVPALAKQESLLAPVDAGAFVDRVVSCAAKNPYLNDVARAVAASGARLPTDARDAVLARVFGYAVALDRLTKLMRDDWRVLRDVRAHWAQYKKGQKHLVVFNLFEKAKFLTMEYVTAGNLEIHKAKKIDADSGRVTLPLNIMEAVLEDLRLGNADNARAGLTLALAKPGEAKTNPRTGAGPTTFSADGRAILYRTPLTKRWADLYSVWNLAFVSHYGRFPLLFAKLLTPQVQCYSDAPAEYVYNRAIALYLHLHQSAFERLERKAAKAAGRPFPAELAWANDDLTKAMSKQNAVSARDYDEALNAADPSVGRTLRLGLAAALEKLPKLAKGALDKLRREVGEPFVAKVSSIGTAVATGAKKAVATVKKSAKKAADKLKGLFKR